MTLHLALYALGICGLLYATLQCVDVWLRRREVKRRARETRLALIADFRIRRGLR